MKKINMVDLNGQYRKIRWQVNREIKKVINTSSFINGPIVKDFQNNLQEYLNVRHVIPCANGTDALQIAMMGLGLNQGDEVITADFTFAATVEVIALLKLTPVLVDVEPDTFNIDIEAIKKAIKIDIDKDGLKANKKYITYFALFTFIPSVLISIFSLFLF